MSWLKDIATAFILALLMILAWSLLEWGAGKVAPARVFIPHEAPR